MFIVVSVASIGPVLAVGARPDCRVLPAVAWCGFFLGIAGTVFAVGIAFRR